MGENRGRWAAGFRSTLLRYVYIMFYICVKIHLFYVQRYVMVCIS